MLGFCSGCGSFFDACLRSGRNWVIDPACRDLHELSQLQRRPLEASQESSHMHSFLFPALLFQRWPYVILILEPNVTKLLFASSLGSMRTPKCPGGHHNFQFGGVTFVFLPRNILVLRGNVALWFRAGAPNVNCVQIPAPSTSLHWVA